ncbi:Carboxypeptidase B, partial [Caligus rogercresseyi]
MGIRVLCCLYRIQAGGTIQEPEKMQNDVRGQVIWYIMPLVNPDGYEYTRTTSRLWRKNRAPPPKGSRCFGVDLNRNWNPAMIPVRTSIRVHTGLGAEVKTAKKLLSGLPDIRHYLGFHSL